jgi:ATP-dependent Clp protease ATP-binding subunit ClpC
MHQRFTGPARRAVVLAREEARMLHSGCVGTEHILLGLLHEGDGAAAVALDLLGISLEMARQQAGQLSSRGQHSTRAGRLPYTARARNVLELSLREALRVGDNHIGTEHIVLALTREPGARGAEILVLLGADLRRLRQQVLLPASRAGQELGTMRIRQDGQQP